MPTPIYDIEGIALDSTSEMVAGSLADSVITMRSHFFGASLVYPTEAAGVPVTAGAAGFGLGGFTEIVPTTTITSDFHISSVAVEAAAIDVYEVILYAVEVEIARFRFGVAAVFIGNAVHDVHAAAVAANSQIQVKLASLAGGTAITLSIQYHLHA